MSKKEENSLSFFGRLKKWTGRQKSQSPKKSIEEESSLEKKKTDHQKSLLEKEIKKSEGAVSQETASEDKKLPSKKDVKAAEKVTEDKLLNKKQDKSSSAVPEKDLKSFKEPPEKGIAETKNQEEEKKVTKAEQPPKGEKEAPPSEKAVEKEKVEEEPSRPQVKLSGLFAFKMEMTSFYKEGESLPVTVLRYEPWRVSQIKNKEKEGYVAIQLACGPQKNKRCPKPLTGHLSAAGFKEGARYIKELREKELPENIQVGQELSIQSLSKGDFVKVSSSSKGRGFSGVMKRWGFHGGKASHGAKTHRKPGSIGQHTEPSRVFAGKKMPGRYGFQKVSLKKVEVVDVLPKEKLIFVKGPVPGSRNTLITLKKMEIS